MKNQKTINFFGVDIIVRRDQSVLAASVLHAFDETQSTYRAFCKENKLKASKWLKINEVTALIEYLAEYNEKARGVFRKSAEHGLAIAPQKLKNEAITFINDTLVETGDCLVNQGWMHPLAEINGEAVNHYGTASIVINALVFNENDCGQAKEFFTLVMREKNIFLDVDQVIHSLKSRLMSVWLNVISEFVENFEIVIQKQLNN